MPTRSYGTTIETCTDILMRHKAYQALNLDGGSSSAFWCHETGISYPAFKQVRNYLGVAPVERR